MNESSHLGALPYQSIPFLAPVLFLFALTLRIRRMRRFRGDTHSVWVSHSADISRNDHTIQSRH